LSQYLLTDQHRKRAVMGSGFQVDLFMPNITLTFQQIGICLQECTGSPSSILSLDRNENLSRYRRFPASFRIRYPRMRVQHNTIASTRSVRADRSTLIRYLKEHCKRRTHQWEVRPTHPLPSHLPKHWLNFD